MTPLLIYEDGVRCGPSLGADVNCKVLLLMGRYGAPWDAIQEPMAMGLSCKWPGPPLVIHSSARGDWGFTCNSRGAVSWNELATRRAWLMGVRYSWTECPTHWPVGIRYNLSSVSLTCWLVEIGHSSYLYKHLSSSPTLQCHSRVSPT